MGREAHSSVFCGGACSVAVAAGSFFFLSLSAGAAFLAFLRVVVWCDVLAWWCETEPLDAESALAARSSSVGSPELAAKRLSMAPRAERALFGNA